MGCYVRMRPLTACSARTAAPVPGSGQGEGPHHPAAWADCSGELPPFDPALADRIAFAAGTSVFEPAGPPVRLDDFQTSLESGMSALAAAADDDAETV